MEAAKALRAARLRSGLTQAALAARSGTSQATISAYEHGRKLPSLDTFSRLLGAMGLRLSVESGDGNVVAPTPRELARAARGLIDVLALAEALPARHERDLRFPRLGRVGLRPVDG